MQSWNGIYTQHSDVDSGQGLHNTPWSSCEGIGAVWGHQPLELLWRGDWVICGASSLYKGNGVPCSDLSSAEGDWHILDIVMQRGDVCAEGDWLRCSWGLSLTGSDGEQRNHGAHKSEHAACRPQALDLTCRSYVSGRPCYGYNYFGIG